MKPARVYIGVGSNIEREKNIRGGLAALARRYGALTLSPVYQARAIGFAGDDFFNLVAAFDTGKTVAELENDLCRIEFEHGRRREEDRFSARTLDLDLLLYGELVSGRHRVPRADITKYAFVLKPLFDLAPDLVHPQTGKRIREIWQAFDFEPDDIRRVDFDAGRG